ncbi:spermatogenesis- and oogenesis-specific basic helix-loop-helix-containing protein 1 [Oreochromis niloticus]|uniref:spermatogenesis- and oogenesis-specific basic helix-loop-helix-containing protein 1 n=1 Tax=Oreochromis niloticus TaxID=8128 RepID=UPI000905CB1A|nr:spermatogenesis- and oogenesis-specific basic helix-loop-helix-containing protein 1 [Oreochromis niloticus]CAI5649052.1 unnamed protein product [Mustela putorius furo]CAI5682526.1 unnamed protein product [Mustela putorius furo]
MKFVKPSLDILTNICFTEPRDGLCAPVPGQSDEVLVTIDSDALMVASPEGEAAGRKGPDPQLWNSSYLERHRRKRITQSCSMLCRLLPTIQGSHVDMVTVLEMTVALLKTVQEVVPAEDPNIQVCPPAALHAH